MATPWDPPRTLVFPTQNGEKLRGKPFVRLHQPPGEGLVFTPPTARPIAPIAWRPRRALFRNIVVVIRRVSFVWIVEMVEEGSKAGWAPSQ